MRQKSSYNKLLVLNEAICDDDLTYADKLVFQRLVWRLNLKTGACFPSVGLIARELSMTDRGVRKCTARLEKQGYLKRRIHSGRTKANDYLIPGLNTERKFPKAGTAIPERRNEESAHRKKEKKKEKEASEDKHPIAGLSPSGESCAPLKMEEGQFQNELVKALGGGAHGWAILTSLPAGMAEVLHQKHLDGAMSMRSAVEFVRHESATHLESI